MVIHLHLLQLGDELASPSVLHREVVADRGDELAPRVWIPVLRSLELLEGLLYGGVPEAGSKLGSRLAGKRAARASEALAARRDYLEELPPAASPPLVPPEAPLLEPPLGALSELGAAELAPAAPCCFTQSARSVPVMPTHWPGTRSLLAPLALEESLVPGEFVDVP